MSLVSFGFKHGVPYDADLVFDVRFLPNPHFVEMLRPLDGRHPSSAVFVLDHPESRELLCRLEDLLKFLLPLYEREGRPTSRWPSAAPAVGTARSCSWRRSARS